MSDLSLDFVADALSTTRAGDVSTTSGLEAVAQRIRLSLEVWAGEWVFDRSYGIDARGRALGKPVSQSVIAAEFRRVVLEVDDVLRVEGLRLVLTGRALSVTGTIRTTAGDLEVSGSAPDITAPLWSLFFTPIRGGWIL